MSETTPELNSPQINADLRLHVRRIVLWRLTAKVHLALFIMVNLLVLSINWAFSPGNLWWLWMVTGWGLVFSAHVFYAVTRVEKLLSNGIYSCTFRLICISYLLTYIPHTELLGAGFLAILGVDFW